ncbi:Uncharacterised protein [Paenibacillus polymyxa]|nr:Uncharacterised protein [Paenibacillus polymyxa]
MVSFTIFILMVLFKSKGTIEKIGQLWMVFFIIDLFYVTAFHCSSDIFCCRMRKNAK